MTENAATMTNDVRIAHEPDRHRWVLMIGDEKVASLTYQTAGERFVLVSTYTDEAYRHRGLASVLTRRVLDDIRLTGRRITIICPFVGDYIQHHPEYADLIDARHRGSGADGTVPEHSDAVAEASVPADAADSDAAAEAAADRVARIMVLGTVAYRGSLSAAGIAEALQAEDVQRWTSISPQALRRQLDALVAAGFVVRSGDGDHAEYSCDASGRAELRRLLLALLDAERFRPFDLLPLLHFVTSLSVAELADGLRRRVLIIDEILDSESRRLAGAPEDGPAHESESIRLDWHRFNADREWSLGFIARLYGGGRSAESV